MLSRFVVGRNEYERAGILDWDGKTSGNTFKRLKKYPQFWCGVLSEKEKNKLVSLTQFVLVMIVAYFFLLGRVNAVRFFGGECGT